jgi:hypothetical protein
MERGTGGIKGEHPQAWRELEHATKLDTVEGYNSTLAVF